MQIAFVHDLPHTGAQRVGQDRGVQPSSEQDDAEEGRVTRNDSASASAE